MRAERIELVESIVVLITLLTLSRVIRSFAKDKFPLSYATTFSNSITLLALISQITKSENQCLVATASDLAFAMMVAFWSLYIGYGSKSIYGSYQPHQFEVWLDHFIIPMSVILLSFLKKAHTTPSRCVKFSLVLAVAWLLYTLMSEPAYPILKHKNGSVHYQKLFTIFIIFSLITVTFEILCSKLSK